MQTLCSLVLAAAAAVQEPPRFSASVEMVRLSVTVQDSHDHYVTDLRESDFTVIENGVRQDIANFRHEERYLNVTFLIDGSDSMLPHLKEAYRTAAQFIEKVRPDTVHIVQFAQVTWTAQLRTTDMREVQGALGQLAMFTEYGARYRDQAKKDSKKPEDIVFRETIREWLCNRALCGMTALYTSIYTVVASNALEKLSGEEADFQRQVIILITDGEDTASMLTADDVVEEAARLEIPIYAIRLGYTGPTKDEADTFLRTLTQRTGGLYEVATAAIDLGGWYRRIADELRSQYHIGYTTSSASRNGEWRPVQISIGRAEHTIRHKQGYYAPCDPDRPCAKKKR